jgi:hypothetical protein
VTVQIRIARTTEELDALFRLRHQVMVEEEGYMAPTHDGRITDRFDAYPTTGNVIAVVGDRVVGGVRFVPVTVAGTPADEYFDFSPYLPVDARPVSAGMLVIAREYRRLGRMIPALAGMGSHWVLSQGYTHIQVPANPERGDLFARSGMRAVAPEFFHEKKKLRVLPMIQDLQDSNDGFIQFARRQRIDHWLSAFERQFHTAGEVIVRGGDPGDAMFVIVDGTASVRAGSEPTGKTLATLGSGEVFGELALLLNQPRSATVVAETELDLMVLSRATFEAQRRQFPEITERLLVLIAQRLYQANGRS